jgi:uncharacterized protein (TIGR03435 family)
MRQYTMRRSWLSRSLRAFALCLVAAGSVSLRAQSPSFEVASVKPNNSGSGSSSESTVPGRLTATNITISSLIQSAFGLKDFQIAGAPGWLRDDKYDIAAKTGTTKDLNEKELRPYLQALLADRFRFRYHRETREMQVYSLVIAKGGVKMKPHEGGGDSTTNVSSGSGRSSMNSTNAAMAHLADLLGGRLDRVVIDNTGLPGVYDLKLEWAPNPSPESTDPSLFTALQEQLGLKLESTKGSVEIIVIDNIERPSEN